MSFVDGLWHRLRVFIGGERYARQIEEEVRFHLEIEEMQQTHTGLPPSDAHAAARRRFGNVTWIREEARRIAGLELFDHFRQDLSYAWRGLKRSPGFTVTVVVTLALGLGLNAAMFSLLDRLFLRAPQGIGAPREIRRLYSEWSRPKEPGGRTAYEWFNYPSFRAIVAAEDSSLQLSAFTPPDSTAITQGDAELPIRRSLVTANYFRLLRVHPQIGRWFAADESRIETPTPVAVISDALWRRAYGADSTIVGKVISIESQSYTVIGVAPKDFTGLDVDAVDVWLPANTYGTSGSDTTPWYDTYQGSFRVIARVSMQGLEGQVVTKATTAFRSVHLTGFQYDSTALVLAGPIVQALGPSTRAKELSISTRLAGVALIVLLIACANVANLLLVRATRRGREIAIRRALGVSGRRLCGQLLTESLLLAVLGGMAAIVFALWAGNALRHLLLPSIQWADGAVDLRTIAFVAVATLFAGVIAGLAPALQATRPDLIGSLRAGAREGAYQRSKLRSALLVAQAALSVVLLVGAGLFVRSLSKVKGLDLGYDVEHALFIAPMLTTQGSRQAETAVAIPQVAERLRSVAGVEAVAFGSSAPMYGLSYGQQFLPDRDSLPKMGDDAFPSRIAVSPNYFRASGMRLLAGRDFSSTDRVGDGEAIVVSQAMARTYWPGTDAIGKCLILDKRTNPCSTVIGVVSDVHRIAVIEKPSMQFYTRIDSAAFLGAHFLVVKTNSRNIAFVSQIATQELTRLLPGALRPRIRTMSQVLEPQFRPWRLGATLFVAFGALALVVAAIGVYSVVAYSVSQRTQEMGVRIALGAQTHDVMRLVLGEGFRIVAVGVVVGILLSIALGRLVTSLLYGVSARDPLVMIAAAAMLLAVGLVASVLPGWRAARVDPVAALRAE